MKSSRTNGLFGTAILSMHVAMAALGGEPAAPGPAANPLLWDTIAPVTGDLKAADRSNWKAVPTDLLLLEKDPPKASSDPGYYGREYSFSGDAVVETPTVAAVFSSAKGSLTIYSREPSETAEWRKTCDVAPLLPGTGLTSITNLEVLRNAGDEVVLQLSFVAQDAKPASALFSFTRTGLIELQPGENLKHLRVSGPIQYGVVPAFIGDDLIFGGPELRRTNSLALPSENLFLGLIQGENSELVMTWPGGKQRIALRFTDPGASLDFDTDGQSVYLTALSAPGIWHKETLTSNYLEKDVKLNWKKPFPAKWRTQLWEEDLKTSFAFRSSEGQVWRGVAGSYQYPVWFSGDDAFYHLGKKVQPKGESLIYCLEPQATPASRLTPADVLQQTLGRHTAAGILDLPGRKLRTHHRRGGDGVRRACTCGCTEAIQAVFEAGEEVSRKEDIQGALDDMIYFVHRHVERISEYQRFADDLLKTIQSKKSSSPTLKPFLDSLEELAQQIPQECDVQKENMKSFAYADELSRKTLGLAAKKDPDNLKTYMELLKDWRAMGGAQDYVVAKCHVITRNLSQAAGYGCASLADAVPLAQDIRARCRQTLRNPDGYEAWADY